MMKRNLLLLLLFVTPFVSFAGKRLTVLTHTSQYKNERGVFTYDDQGRISRVEVTDGQNNVQIPLARESGGFFLPKNLDNWNKYITFAA